MNGRHKLTVNKQRPVHAYAELWHASHCVLEVGLREPKGSSWQFLSSSVLTAFTFEAYLNHIGPSIVADWAVRERYAMWSKFNHLRKTLGVSFPGGKSVRPLKTISELFAFRVSLAHGRSVELRVEKHQSAADFEKEHADLVRSQIRTDWENRIQSPEFAERSRADVEAVIRALDAARKDNPDILFNSGVGFHSASLA